MKGTWSPGSPSYCDRAEGTRRLRGETGTRTCALDSFPPTSRGQHCPFLEARGPEPGADLLYFPNHSPPHSCHAVSVESVPYGCEPAPELTHKRLCLVRMEGGLCDTVPVLTYPAAEAYHQLKRRNHELIDMLPSAKGITDCR